MYLLGPSDPNLTMRIYQHVVDMDGGALEKLEEILGCGVEEAFATLSVRKVLAPNRHRTLDSAADGSSQEATPETHV